MTNLPLFDNIQSVLATLSGVERPIFERTTASGGGIHDSAVYTLKDDQRFFIKQNTPDRFDSFNNEAAGLQALATDNLIPVAEPLALGKNDTSAFLVLKHITSGQPHRDTWAQFGARLATLHLEQSAAQYGWENTNQIGDNPQSNQWHDDWITFFAEQRLQPQLDKARTALDTETHRKGEQLIATLECYITPPPRPQLIHGDLWSGNAMINADGDGVLIDPAAYYGHGEADLAMTQLFGGFPQDFYRGYHSVNPIADGFAQRATVYNLYHLLNHLNLFGSGYLGVVRNAINSLV